MKALIICNDPPYGTERSWNGLRLAGALSKRDGVEVKVFCSVTPSGVPPPARRCPTATTTSTA